MNGVTLIEVARCSALWCGVVWFVVWRGVVSGVLRSRGDCLWASVHLFWSVEDCEVVVNRDGVVLGNGGGRRRVAWGGVQWAELRWG